MGGRVVALLEARRASELAELVKTYGGVPLHAPALREEPIADLDGVACFLDAIAAGPLDLFVFQTGVGARSLLAAADALGREQELLAALAETTVALRWPKPAAVLREAGVRIDVRAAEPFTTQTLLEALNGLPLDGKTVAVQHYGETNDELVGALERRGARVLEVATYRWALPEDLGPLHRLFDELLASRVDALVVTSQVQVRHMVQVANQRGLGAALTDLFDTRVVMAPVGPVAAAALRAHGLRVDLEPEHPKMGALVRALAERFATAKPRRVVCPE